MSIAPRRIIFRWTSAAPIFSILILLVSTALISIFHSNYLMTRGLENKYFQLDNLLSIPYLYIPLVGFLAVSLSTWMYLILTRTTMIAKPGIRLPQKILPMRMLEGVFTVMAILSSSLFLPYIIGSNWMMNNLVGSKSSPQGLRELFMSFYSNALVIMDLTPLWKYFFSNALSLMIVVAITLLIARRPTRRVKPR